MSSNLNLAAYGTSWKFILLCISALIMIHYLLVEFEPDAMGNADTKEASNSLGGSKGAVIIATPTQQARPGTFEEFRAMFGLSALTDETDPISKQEDHGGKRPLPAGSQLGKPNSRDDEYMSICMAVKDQHRDLPEFFTHHYHHLGIKRFYVMDDGSDPPLSELTDLGIPREHVTFQYFNRSEHQAGMQNVVYGICAETYRSNHTWMAFMDADEYLEMTGSETLNQFLESFEDNDHVGAIAVSWRTHSSAGVLERPKSCRKAYTDCIWDKGGHNTLYKTIARLSRYHSPGPTVHQVTTTAGSTIVDEHGMDTPTVRRDPPTKDRIALHHYALKSRQEYQEKCDRGNAMDDPKDWTFWNSVEGMAGIECLSMTEYEP